MRIHHYVSIIFAIAIGGAVGLAVIVGSLTGGLEGAAHESGKAADQYHQVKSIVSDAAEFAQNSPEPEPSELYTDVLVEA